MNTRRRPYARLQIGGVTLTVQHRPRPPRLVKLLAATATLSLTSLSAASWLLHHRFR